MKIPYKYILSAAGAFLIFTAVSIHAQEDAPKTTTPENPKTEPQPSPSISSPAPSKTPDTPKTKIKVKNYIANGSFELGLGSYWKAFGSIQKRNSPEPLKTFFHSSEIISTAETVHGSNLVKLPINPASESARELTIVSRPFKLSDPQISYIFRIMASSLLPKAEISVSIDSFSGDAKISIPVFRGRIDKIPREWSQFDLPVGKIPPGFYTLSVKASISSPDSQTTEKDPKLCFDAVQLLAAPSEALYSSDKFEFGVDTDFQGNILLANEQGFIHISGYNYDEDNSAAEVILSISDIRGNEISSEKYEFNRMDGFADKTVALPALPVNVYLARVRDTQGNIFAESSFAVLPQLNTLRRSQSSELSSNAAKVQLDKTQLDTISRSAMKFIMLDCVAPYSNFAADQKIPLPPPPESLDNAIKSGFIPVGIINIDTKAQNRPFPDKEYLRAILLSYKGRINYWYIPAVFFIDNDDPRGYSELLKCIAQIARENTLDLKLIGPGSRGNEANWLNEFVELGTLQLLDIFAVRGYGFDDITFEQIKKWAWADSRKRPVWDIGLSVIQSASQYTYPRPRSDKPVRIKACSALAKALIWRAKAGVERSFYDSYIRGTGWDNDNMFEPDGAVKPEAVTYAAVSRMLKDYTFVKEVKLGRIRAFVFKNKEKSLAALWNTEYSDDDETKALLQPQEYLSSYLAKYNPQLARTGTGAIPINIPLRHNKGVELKDILGNNIPLNDRDESNISLSIKHEPVFIAAETNSQILCQTLEKSRISIPDGTRIGGLAYLKNSAVDDLIAFSLIISNMSSQTLYPEIKILSMPDAITLMGNESVKITLGAFEEKNIEFLLKFEKNVYEKANIKYEIADGSKKIIKDFNFNVFRATKIEGEFNIDGKSSEWPSMDSPMKIDHISQLLKGDQWNGPSDMSLKSAFFYNDEYVFLILKANCPAKDSPLSLNSFEFFFDTNPDNITYNGITPDDYHISFIPQDSPGTNFKAVSPSFKDPKMLFCISREGADYTGEFRFSRKALKLDKPDSVLRFDMNMNKLGPDGKPQIIMSWSGTKDNINNTEDYGYILIGE